MANALAQPGVFRNFYGGQDDAAQAQQQNALAGMRQQQFAQQNQLFQQGQQDRQKEQQLEGVRADLVSVLIARKQGGPEAYKQAWSQVAPKYNLQDRDPEQFLPELLQRNPRILGDQASAAVLKDFVQPATPNLPNSAQEYQFAQQQGYRGSYQDWMREQKTQVQQFRTDNPSAPKVRPLPQPAINKLTEAGADLEQLSRLNTGFKDEYGGHAILGDLTNTVGRIAGDDTGQAQWWQDYQTHVNEVRNRLFGSALTLPEKAEFYKAMVTPRMDAKEIRKNLKRQNELAQTAARKLSKAYSVQGYNQEALDELVPPELLAVPAPQEGGGDAVQINSDEEYDALPPGASFIDPEGNERVKP